VKERTIAVGPKKLRSVVRSKKRSDVRTKHDERPSANGETP
jgi:hypothetical protein